jgi:hypothetical protein
VKANAYDVFMRKPKGKRQSGKLRRRGDYTITTSIKSIGLKVVDWNDLAQDKDKWRFLVNTAIKCRKRD